MSYICISINVLRKFELIFNFLHNHNQNNRFLAYAKAFKLSYKVSKVYVVAAAKKFQKQLLFTGCIQFARAGVFNSNY